MLVSIEKESLMHWCFCWGRAVTTVAVETRSPRANQRYGIYLVCVYLEDSSK